MLRASTTNAPGLIASPECVASRSRKSKAAFQSSPFNEISRKPNQLRGTHWRSPTESTDFVDGLRRSPAMPTILAIGTGGENYVCNGAWRPVFYNAMPRWIVPEMGWADHNNGLGVIQVTRVKLFYSRGLKFRYLSAQHCSRTGGHPPKTEGV